MELMKEEFDGAEAYQLAAAEVVRTQFAGQLEIAPSAELKLYIFGTKRTPNGCQFVQVSVVKHEGTQIAGRIGLFGLFHFSDSGGIACNYSEERIAQEVKAETYSVVGKFLKNFSDAPTEDEWRKQHTTPPVAPQESSPGHAEQKSGSRVKPRNQP